jgi:hypothetical protein
MPQATPRLASTDPLEEAARAAALQIDRCPGGALVLTTPGDRELTPDETADFLKAHRPPPRFDFLTPGIDSSGFGGCDCARPAPGGCIRVEMWEDSPAVRSLPPLFARAIADEQPGARMRVEVSLIPLPVVRCGPWALGCGPLPYDRAVHNRPRPPGRRQLVYPRANGGGRCSYDGECTIACTCSRWDTRDRICDLLYPGELRGAWCGCVDGACAWFR